MRLLRLGNAGEFGLVEFTGKNIPRYAILSHTWGADDEEVTFKDLLEGTGKSKPGYNKIRFCEQQATKDGLLFFWVDTCCIDKSSSTELFEAINSMFRWYRDATKCYVYLSDVPINGCTEDDLTSPCAWISVFERSRWFSRGWTLQELLAPASVEFFSVEGERLGEKDSMVQQIHKITGINIHALQGRPLSAFSIDERISWAARRETKREEDAAYSLLGIFDVYMPLIYGEGRERALVRLRKEIKESLRDGWPVFSQNSTAGVAGTRAVGKLRKYDIPFTLKGVPLRKFADRPQDRERLDQVLLPQNQDRKRRVLVIHGLGGVGKTQLAAEFACRNQHYFTSVFWLDGSGESSLKQSIAGCASRIPAGQVAETSKTYASGQGGDINAVVKDVLAWLAIAENHNWLVVIDNVDREYKQHVDTEAYDVGEYLPEANHGSVLITTRLPHLGQLGEQWEVKKVDEQRSRTIFETWYGKEIGQRESKKLLELLDGLPLALAQAAAYMSETGVDFDTYTRLYQRKWRELMELQSQGQLPPQTYSKGSVAMTWMISYSAIRERNEAAANLLLLWAHLDNRSLWYDLLAGASQRSATAAARISAWIKGIAGDEIEFIKAIGLLRSYSLVEKMQDQTGYAMHPVVHQWALHIQDERQRANLSWVAIAIVGLSVPSRDERKYWKTRMDLFAHVERCKRSIEESMKDWSSEDKSDQQKKEDKTVFWAIHNLGILYKDMGKLDEAEKMYMRALEGYTKVLGADHTWTLNTVNNLGNLYKGKGKLDEAEKMYNRALEGYKNALGADHALTLSTTNNLGNLYKGKGKLDEAEEMYNLALEGYTKALGATHTSTLSTTNNLGNLYRDQGKLDKAEGMLMRALEGYQKVLGEDHTSTLVTVNNLGNLYKDQGKLDMAEKMHMRALEGYKEALGTNHMWTLNTISNLGALHAERGKLDEAERLYMQVIEGYENIVGRENIPSFIPALNTMRALASLFVVQNRVQDARILYSRALSGYQKVFGDDHPWYQTLHNDLATLGMEGD